jgi:hypothetical protein
MILSNFHESSSESDGRLWIAMFSCKVGPSGGPFKDYEDELDGMGETDMVELLWMALCGCEVG